MVFLSEYDVFLAVGIVIFGILISKIVSFILKNKIRKLVEKTKTDVDDVVLGIFEKPLEYGIILLSLYVALISMEAFTSYRELISNIFFVIFVFLVATVMYCIVSFFIPRWILVKNKRYEKSPQIIIRVLGGLVYLIAILVILEYFHIEITPIIAALGVGGLAVGLALQDSLSNFFAGLYIVSASPIQIGNFIEIPSEKISGYVEEISWREVRIRTLQNSFAIVPNSKLSQAVVINMDLPNKEVAVLIDCGVAYNSDLEKVEKVAVEVATKIQKTVQGAVKSFKPYIRYHTFGDSNINFTVIMRAEDYVSQNVIKHEFIKALKKEFDKKGIEISFPVRTVYIENKTKG